MQGSAFIQRAPLNNSLGYWIPDYSHVTKYLIVRIVFSQLLLQNDSFSPLLSIHVDR